MRDPGHYVQFFDGDDGFVAAACRFIQEGIESGCTCIVAATPVHSEQIEARLRESGLDPAALAAAYSYIALDARSTLATLMKDGRLDSQRFHNDMGLLMRQAASRGQPVYAVGEAAPLLMEDGLAATAIQLEELWNELSRHHNFTLFCIYARAPFTSAPTSRTFDQICAVHSHVIAG